MKRFLSKSLFPAGLVALGLFASSAPTAQANCSVNYKITNSWGNGGQADVTLTNLGSAKTSWELCWTFNGNEAINNLWNGTRTQNGKSVCVKSASYNGNLATNGSANFGFTHNNAPGAIPTNFTLNDAVCGGSTSSQPMTSSSRSSASSQPTTSSSSSVPPGSSRSSISSQSSASSSSAPAVTARWLINETKSLLNFVSVKNTDVAEAFTFTQLQGTVAANGQATLTIPLGSISTGIDLRNTRMKQMLFETDILPSMHFTTTLDLAAIDAMPVGGISNQVLTGNLVLHGISKAISFDALMIKHAANSVSVSPRKPILINSTDYDLNAGIEALRMAVGASSIGERVPVYFKMFLTRDNPGNLPAIRLAQAPSAPISLMGTMNNTTASASLTWTDTSATESGFLIRRNDINNRWVTVGKVSANIAYFTNGVENAAGAADFKSVTYKVIGYTDSIPSEASNSLGLTYTYQFGSTSSSSSVSSRSASSSSAPMLMGDAARGKTLWESPAVGCLFCHAVNADGTAGSSLSKIDPRNLRFTTSANIVKYIEDNMPKSDPAACVGQCAADTAAYFLSLKPAMSSSSSSRSASSVSSSVISNLTGEQLYTQKGCANCHGARGDNPMRPIVVDRWTRNSLITKIDSSMPLNDPSSCVGDCATKIADYILTWKPPVVCTTGEDILPRRLRLLTNREYANTINDLLGVTTGATVAATLEPDTKVKGFDNVNAKKINSSGMDTYWNAAKNLATNVSLTSLMSCSTSTPRDQCASTFVPAFGKRAFRRPLTSAEQTSYNNLFRLGASNDAGARLVIQAMLASPNFLYRSEIGSTFSGTGSLTQYETASLLAYTFTGSMPDATLFTEADNNRLNTPAQLRTQAERLLGTAKASTQFAYFGQQWLHVDDLAALQRDKTLYPQFTTAIGAAMKTELDSFLTEIFLKPGYKIADVFNPGFSFLNGPLASYYGIAGVSGDQFQKVATNAQRGGVLHLGAITATLATQKESHPIHRGLLVRRNLLCQEFAPPPPNVGEVEPLDPNKPTRQRFAAHTSNTNCQSCHQYIDNIGFGFENYDAVGRFRTLEGNNIPVDASGSISGLAVMTETDSYNFTDLRGLSTVLASSGAQAASKCVTQQYQRFATGVSDPNQCSVDASYSRWQGKSTDLRDMMLETVTSPSYLNRK
ncbi:DUF1592 domain-containing protein [Cellvibrio sp. KY-GH-1]|uniref:DUF1592 domain-containing protein n=1 Tax=Cellvibrio sp. KY-GH-1 TaxID=2303332 RepID=UPI001245D59B|nr:DUF1592 domain-containing protein [Cellvibrio sp. KY-GH-1]QEY14664.1 DUF1592 domain-containing protein [Cellvibrio sp. KY-GH-1]